MTPQHNKILNLLSDNRWHCGTEILQLFIKDDRKRISELKKMGYVILSERCDCGKHNSNTFKRKLIGIPGDYVKSEIKLEKDWWNKAEYKKPETKQQQLSF